MLRILGLVLLLTVIFAPRFLHTMFVDVRSIFFMVVAAVVITVVYDKVRRRR